MTAHQPRMFSRQHLRKLTSGSSTWRVAVLAGIRNHAKREQRSSQSTSHRQTCPKLSGRLVSSPPIQLSHLCMMQTRLSLIAAHQIISLATSAETKMQRPFGEINSEVRPCSTPSSSTLWTYRGLVRRRIPSQCLEELHQEASLPWSTSTTCRNNWNH